MMIIKVIYLNLKYSNTQLNILFTLCIIMLSTFLRLGVLYITTMAFLGMHYIVFSPNVQLKPCSLKIKKIKINIQRSGEILYIVIIAKIIDRNSAGLTTKDCCKV